MFCSHWHCSRKKTSVFASGGARSSSIIIIYLHLFTSLRNTLIVHTRYPAPKFFLEKPFDLSNWVTHGSPVSRASFLAIFSLLCPSILDLESCSGQTDRQTDRQRHAGHQRLMSPPVGGRGRGINRTLALNSALGAASAEAAASDISLCRWEITCTSLIIF